MAGSDKAKATMQAHKRASFIGRVFQDPMRGTAPNLTIEENLALAYSRSKRGPLHFALNKKDSAFFRESLARYDMGLENLANHSGTWFPALCREYPK